jgi:membrane protease YdiL (CAAX protease family)
MSDDLLYSHPVVVEIEPETYRSSTEGLPSSRLPHLGHAILFLSFAWLVTTLVFSLTAQFLHAGPGKPFDPQPQLAAQFVVYLIVLASCVLTFPLFWERGFLTGINWNGRQAARLIVRLVSLGLCVGWTVQAISSLVPTPKSMPMDNFFRTRPEVWMVAAFATLVAPVFEEITFRGILLPAIAIVVDWLRPALGYVARFSIARLRGREVSREIVFFREDASAGLAESIGNLHFRSRTAIVFASLATSALFARIHSDQLAHSVGALYILFCVSLVLTVVRVQTRSVACSTLVHACYNLSVFITLFLGTGGFRHLDKLAR